ncbi:MAG: 3,4-dihydroxy-2-butanone-4-phosphate synthase [Candidatus Hadarchaeales archaeon]
MSFEDAIKDLRKGKFILIHDFAERENEVDFVVLAEKVKPEHIAQMRRDGGGLICTAIHPRIAENFGLPYLTEIFEIAGRRFSILELSRADDLPYDERSSFSISVNHRKTFTGITDRDRALTIRELGRLGAKAMKKSVVNDFGRNFRTPGHVPILRAADGLLSERRGHTELAVAIAEIAGTTPVLSICEMVDGNSGGSLSKRDAEKYAELHGLQLLSGNEVLRKWRELS